MHHPSKTLLLLLFPPFLYYSYVDDKSAVMAFGKIMKWGIGCAACLQQVKHSTLNLQ